MFQTFIDKGSFGCAFITNLLFLFVAGKRYLWVHLLQDLNRNRIIAINYNKIKKSNPRDVNCNYHWLRVEGTLMRQIYNTETTEVIVYCGYVIMSLNFTLLFANLSFV